MSASILSFESDRSRYVVGDVATITVHFDAAVDVSIASGKPAPVLSLSNGARAVYVSGSGTNALQFRYLVAPTDSSEDDLAVMGVVRNDAVFQSLDSSGEPVGLADLRVRVGSSSEGASNDIIYRGASVGSSDDDSTVEVITQSLSTGADLIAPRLTSLSATSGTYSPGSVLEIKAAFNEVVAVDADRFRADLYHLLTPIVIHLPRLNDRRDDIPTLFRSVLFDLTKSYDYPIEEGAFKLLMSHEFSGNLIELRNIASRALSSSSGRPITEDAVRAALRGTSYSDRDAYKLTESLSIVSEDFKALDNELSRGALSSAAQAPVAAQPTQRRDTDSVFNSTATQMSALRELDDASAHSSGPAPEAPPIASVATPSRMEAVAPPAQEQKVLSLKEQEAAYFQGLLDRFDGNKAKAADAAGLTLRTLYRRLKDAGIE